MVGHSVGAAKQRAGDGLVRLALGHHPQHLRAKELLDRSGLPVTYINNAAYFMDNFLSFFPPPK